MKNKKIIAITTAALFMLSTTSFAFAGEATTATDTTKATVKQHVIKKFQNKKADEMKKTAEKKFDKAKIDFSKKKKEMEASRAKLAFGRIDKLEKEIFVAQIRILALKKASVEDKKATLDALKKKFDDLKQERKFTDAELTQIKDLYNKQKEIRKSDMTKEEKEKALKENKDKLQAIYAAKETIIKSQIEQLTTELTAIRAELKKLREDHKNPEATPAPSTTPTPEVTPTPDSTPVPEVTPAHLYQK